MERDGRFLCYGNSQKMKKKMKETQDREMTIMEKEEIDEAFLLIKCGKHNSNA